MNEVIFEVRKYDDDGIYFTAKSIGHSIFTEGNTIDEITKNIKEAVECHFDDEYKPEKIRIIFVEKELILS